MTNNRYTLTGNIVKTSFHTDKNDNEFAVIELATNETYTNKTGENVTTDPVFHTLMVFYPHPLAVAKTLTKGSLIKCTGSIDYQTRQFDTSEGNRYVKEASLKCNWIDVIILKEKK